MGVRNIPTQPLWLVLTAAVIGLTAWAGGPSALLGRGTSVALAQSSKAEVAHLLGIMQNSNLSQEAKDERIARILARSPDAASVIISLLVTGGVSKTGDSLAGLISNTLVQVAKTNPSLQASIGTGMGKAAAVMAAFGYAGAAATMNTAVTNSGLFILQVAASKGAAAAAGLITNVGLPTVRTIQPSPAQICSGASCN